MRIHEFKCGCIIHPLAGAIRVCGGVPSKSLTGRPVAKPDGSEEQHKRAMNSEPVRSYPCAEILP